jgi:hypothetical protein
MVWSWGSASDPVMAYLARQGIEPHEVQWVLNHDPRWPRPARSGVTGVATLTFWGRTVAGRALMVATRQVDEREWEIVGARDLRAAELVEFEAWEAAREQ